MPITNKKLSSMTGYARHSIQVEGGDILIEIRSVNSRGLDIRLRISSGFEELEQKLKKIIANRLTRGSLAISITYKSSAKTSEISINEQALGTVLDAIDALSTRIEADRPRLDGILALRGVLETRDAQLSEQARAILIEQIREKFEVCLEELLESRQLEGEKLKLILLERLDEINHLIKLANNHPSRKREVILERLKQQVSDLVELNPSFTQERLMQEAALLATKADIREELDRLDAHASSARQFILDGGAIGRKLDFLSQEFNREANTLCSKSNAVDLTSIGLDLKVVIDQFREQVANIE